MTWREPPVREGLASLTWLADATEASLRSALGAAAPELAGLALRMNPALVSSNPLWWSATAVVDESFVVKFAWSKLRAVRLWREGVILRRLERIGPALPIPEVAVVTTDPVLVATRMVPGVPLGGEWAWELAGSQAQQAGRQVGTFLAQLHALDAAQVWDGLPVVDPTPQGDTEMLRRRFPALVDHRRGALVQAWCEWVDAVLSDESPSPAVFVHGDLHGYNQVWDQAERRLVAVVDFGESGLWDPHFDRAPSDHLAEHQ
ncbi:MAG: phosphotransferase family protein [Acidimicrobiales bacterium]